MGSRLAQCCWRKLSCQLDCQRSAYCVVKQFNAKPRILAPGAKLSKSGIMATKSPRQSDLPVVFTKKSNGSELKLVLNVIKLRESLKAVEKPPSICAATRGIIAPIAVRSEDEPIARRFICR